MSPLSREPLLAGRRLNPLLEGPKPSGMMFLKRFLASTFRLPPHRTKEVIDKLFENREGSDHNGVSVI
jgi:hypothetical protein